MRDDDLHGDDPGQRDDPARRGRGCAPGENRGGGPKTEEGRQRALDALARAGESRISHGAERWVRRTLAPPCDKCWGAGECAEYEAGGTCSVALRMQADLVREIMDLEHIQDYQRPQVEEYAVWAVAAQIVDVYLQHAGLFRVQMLHGVEVHDVQPVANFRDRVSATLRSLAADLLLTPAAQARMKLRAERGGSGFEQLQMLFAEVDRRRADGVIEGQFELDGEGA